MLPQLAEGDANKVFVVPSEFAQAFGGIGEALSEGAERAEKRPPGTRPARRRAAPRRGVLRPAGPASARPAAARAARIDRRCSTRSPRSSRGRSSDVRQRGTLTEQDIDAAMREIRLALLEADVNFKVVRQFTAAAEGALPRRGGRRQAEPRPAGREDRQRGADRADGRRLRRSELLAAPADGDPDGRPAGLGQDDRDGEARPLPARGALLVGRGGRLRRLPPGGGRAAREGRRAGRRDGLRAGHRSRPGRDRHVGARARPRGGQGRADRRHQRPPARRRGADGRARADPRRRQTARRAARRRRDDRPGRRQRRRELRRGRAVRRRRDEQARRRRPRRRGAVGQGGHRQADPVRLHRREARAVRALPPRPHGAADPRHGRRDEPDREGRAAVRRGRGDGARAQAAAQRVRARRLPRPAAR